MVINTRQDLDELLGTPEYDQFIEFLRGSMIRKEDKQVYPENYNTPEYTGEILEPIWEDVEDLSTIKRFKFTKKSLA